MIYEKLFCALLAAAIAVSAWTVTYNNHDTEGAGSKQERSACLESLGYCIFERDDEP